MKRLRGFFSFTLAVLGMACLLASNALAQSPAELERFQAQMLSPTVQLNENCSGSLIYSARDAATGKVRTVVLTAKHCVADNAKSRQAVDVPRYQKNRLVRVDRFYGRVAGQSAASDLALVELDDTDTYFAQVAKVSGEEPPLVMGEDVWSVGYPRGLPLTITPGLFGSYETSDYPSPGTEYIRGTAAINPGNSGGGLYHRAGEDFELIGVTSMGFRDALFFLNYYTPPSRIREYLKAALPEAIGIEAPKKATSGL